MGTAICKFKKLAIFQDFFNHSALDISYHAGDKVTHTYGIHVNPISVRPLMLEVFLKSLSQRVWNLVEADELPNSYHLSVIAGCARVQPLDYG